ncbi:MAG: hypothetical protein ACRD0Z_01415, partial [Acidimicrobiales bacterium]
VHPSEAPATRLQRSARGPECQPVWRYGSPSWQYAPDRGGLQATSPCNGLRRAGLLQQAKAHLAAELDKHSGRARWDLVQRLDGARRHFEVAMRQELDGAVEAINEAAGRAGELHEATEADRQRRRHGDELVLSAARRAMSAGERAR